jgi:hypothetical protein
MTEAAAATATTVEAMTIHDSRKSGDEQRRVFHRCVDCNGAHKATMAAVNGTEGR